MMNRFILMGKIADIKNKYVTLAIPRNYKNSNYEDVIDYVKVYFCLDLCKHLKKLKVDFILIKGFVRDNKLVANEVKFLPSKDGVK